MDENKVTLLNSQQVREGKFFKQFKAADEASILTIPTDDLVVGSDIILTNSTADYFQWNGTAWKKAD